MTVPADRPDPQGIIQGVLLAPHVQDTGELAKAIAAKLAEHGCLRQTYADWPAGPPGSLVVREVRVTDYLGEDDQPVFAIRAPDDSRWSDVILLLDLAHAEMLGEWRASRGL